MFIHFSYFQVGEDFRFFETLEVFHLQKRSLSFSLLKFKMFLAKYLNIAKRSFYRIGTKLVAAHLVQINFSYVPILKKRSTLIPAVPTSSTLIHPPSIWKQLRTFLYDGYKAIPSVRVSKVISDAMGERIIKIFVRSTRK